MKDLNLNLHRDKVEKLHLYGDLNSKDSRFVEKLFTKNNSAITRKELNYLLFLYSNKLEEKYK